MKKTISINIGGIIFHIEEDGYEKLKGYLSSIQKYFSSFEDSKEIISDIEGRVAERFLNKLKTENKQVISLEDVEELIAAMGTVADFEAIEQAEDIIAEPLHSASIKNDTEYQEAPKLEAPKVDPSQPTGPRKLYRDLKRKLIGGVAAGLANYLSVDPIWIRLVFLVFTAGFLPAQGAMGLNMEDFFGPLSGITFLVYIAMWVAFPGSNTLEEDTKIKKFYRDPDRKVVGGVAAGVSSYFGVDLGVVRFIWVISILFFGTGFLIYIVLWIIAPNANTLTEKMEMQGEPITLSNIESNIKQSLNLNEQAGEENTVTRLLLLPFRAIAAIFSAIGRLLKGLGPIVRILIGVILIIISASSLLGIVLGGAVLLGLTTTEFPNMPPFFRMLQGFPTSLMLSSVLAVTIPFITFLLLGLTLVSNRRIVGGSVWLTLLGLWVVGIIVATVQGIGFQQNFAKRGEVTTTTYYSMPAKGMLTLDRQYGYDEETIDLNIKIEGYNGNDSLKLDKIMSSKGRSRDVASKLASELRYSPAFQDSVLIFKDGPTWNDSNPLMEQRIEAVLNVPYDKPFIITQSFWNALSRWNQRSNHLERYNLNDDADWNSLRWAVRRDSGLVCINLPEKYLHSRDDDRQESSSDYGLDDDGETIHLGERGTYIKQFALRDFKKVDIGGAYSVTIKHGDDFGVSADGEESDVDDLKVTVEEGVLKVKRSKEWDFFSNRKWARVGLIITMPTVEEISLSGANKTIVTGFSGLSKLGVNISGASKAEVDVQVDEIILDLSGASKARLKGSAKNAKMDLSGACKLDARGMAIQSAEVDASGASKAELGKIANIRKHTSGASKVDSQQ